MDMNYVKTLHTKQALKDYLNKVISIYQSTNSKQFLTKNDFKDIGQQFNYSKDQVNHLLDILPHLRIETDSPLISAFHYFILSQIPKYLPSKTLIVSRKKINNTLASTLPIKDNDINNLIKKVPIEIFIYQYTSESATGSFNLMSRLAVDTNNLYIKLSDCFEILTGKEKPKSIYYLYK